MESSLELQARTSLSGAEVLELVMDIEVLVKFHLLNGEEIHIEIVVELVFNHLLVEQFDIVVRRVSV